MLLCPLGNSYLTFKRTEEGCKERHPYILKVGDRSKIRDRGTYKITQDLSLSEVYIGIENCKRNK